MVTDVPFNIRQVDEAGVQLMLDWARLEGWNPGLADAAPFLAADSEGYFLAEVDGEAAAAISVVNHDAATAFLGLYICKPTFRGKGIGYALWQKAMGHAGSRRIGLDGVPAQQHNYAKSGFIREGSTLRFQGKFRPARHGDVRLCERSDFDSVMALDEAAVGYGRRRFLGAWTAPDETRRTVVLEGGGELAGYATIRRCHSGAKIGPLVASDAEAALSLAEHACAILGETFVTLDVPQRNEDLIKRLEALDFACSFPTARMWRGEAPKQNGDMQAVGTLELG